MIKLIKVNWSMICSVIIFLSFIMPSVVISENINDDQTLTSSAADPYTIYGYTTHPNRGQGTISDWTVIANYDDIVPETIAQIGLMWSTQGGVANDSVVMYVANDLWTIMQNDYVAAFPSDPHWYLHPGTELPRLTALCRLRGRGRRA